MSLWRKHWRWHAQALGSKPMVQRIACGNPEGAAEGRWVSPRGMMWRP